jgi:hypothetical protein
MTAAPRAITPMLDEHDEASAPAGAPSCSTDNSLSPRHASVARVSSGRVLRVQEDNQAVNLAVQEENAKEKHVVWASCAPAGDRQNRRPSSASHARCSSRAGHFC